MHVLVCVRGSVRVRVGNGVQALIVAERPKCSGYCLNVKNGWLLSVIRVMDSTQVEGASDPAPGSSEETAAASKDGQATCSGNQEQQGPENGAQQDDVSNDDEIESSEENLRVLKTMAKSQFTNARREILSKIAHGQHVSSAELDALSGIHKRATSVIGDLLSLFASTVDKQEIKERRTLISELEKLEELYSDATEKAASVLYSTQPQQEPQPMDTGPGLHNGAGFSPFPLPSSDNTVPGSSSIGSSSMRTEKRVVGGNSPGNASAVSVLSVGSAVSVGAPAARAVQFPQHATAGERTAPLLTGARSVRHAARSFFPSYRDSGIAPQWSEHPDTAFQLPTGAASPWAAHSTPVVAETNQYQIGGLARHMCIYPQSAVGAPLPMPASPLCCVAHCQACDRCFASTRGRARHRCSRICSRPTVQDRQGFSCVCTCSRRFRSPHHLDRHRAVCSFSLSAAAPGPT